MKYIIEEYGGLMLAVISALLLLTVNMSFLTGTFAEKVVLCLG